jgi:hypothetical protein
MGYVIAAYAIVAGSLLWYGLRLARERRALRRSLGEGGP